MQTMQGIRGKVKKRTAFEVALIYLAHCMLIHQSASSTQYLFDNRTEHSMDWKHLHSFNLSFFSRLLRFHHVQLPPPSLPIYSTQSCAQRNAVESILEIAVAVVVQSTVTA